MSIYCRTCGAAKGDNILKLFKKLMLQVYFLKILKYTEHERCYWLFQLATVKLDYILLIGVYAIQP